MVSLQAFEQSPTPSLVSEDPFDWPPPSSYSLPEQQEHLLGGFVAQGAKRSLLGLSLVPTTTRRTVPVPAEMETW